MGRSFRNADAVERTAIRIANAIFNFADDYLPHDITDQAKVPDYSSQDVVRIGVYVDQGPGRSVNHLLEVLATFPSLSIDLLNAEGIRGGILGDYDVLIQPGGSGGGQGRHLGAEGREQIRDYLSDGGGYIGICAGTYLASADYDWAFHVLDAKVIDRKHWARDQGDVEIGLTEAGQIALQLNQEKLTIHYGQGSLLAPANREDIEIMK